MKLKVVIFLLALFLFIPTFLTKAAVTANSLNGKILLQVESHGEAWYINPKDGSRYYMKDGDAALKLMREVGIGISNDNLKKIPVADANLEGDKDTDSDGLSDSIEDALGTNKVKADSDGDGYNDKDEVVNGYNPVGVGKNSVDSKLSKSQVGKILLQVESHGEAWYVNPNNNKRYFLGRPSDAYNLMRSLGLGITNANLSKIVENKNNNKTVSGVNTKIDCGKDSSCFLKAVKTCTPAIVKITRDVNVFGLFIENVTETTSLTGIDSSKRCGYSSYVDDVANLSYTPEMQAMIKAGIEEQGESLTEAEMAEALKVPEDSIASAKSSIGLTTKCSFDTSYLVGLYEKWDKGVYSSSDLTPGNCTLTDKSGKLLPMLTSSSPTSSNSTSSSSTSSNLNGNLEIEWGAFTKTKDSFDKDMWSMPIKITNNENKMVILDINGTGKGINWSWRVEDTLESGESKIINLEIDHYLFDEVAYSKKDINISAYECSKLSANDAKDICLSGWGNNVLSPWEVLEDKKDAGTPISPTLTSEKYFNFNSLTVSPLETSKDEYLK